jgi:hypothetical protein
MERDMACADEIKLDFVDEDGRVVLYCVRNGKRIAKRSAGESWINLEPGYSVRGGEPGTSYDGLIIEYRPWQVQPQ